MMNLSLIISSAGLTRLDIETTWFRVLAQASTPRRLLPTRSTPQGTDFHRPGSGPTTSKTLLVVETG